MAQPINWLKGGAIDSKQASDAVGLLRYEGLKAMSRESCYVGLRVIYIQKGKKTEAVRALKQYAWTDDAVWAIKEAQ
jgi:hypothetical protein